MYLPSLQPVSHSDFYVSGNVKIHESVVVSPGVILQASANAQITIEAGVCIGMGVIINAYQGKIEIGNNTIIGAGVLIIGKTKIGEQVCIGTSSTIFNANIESLSIISPGSLIGDYSRQLTITNQPLKLENIDINSEEIEPINNDDELWNLDKEIPEDSEILESKLEIEDSTIDDSINSFESETKPEIKPEIKPEEEIPQPPKSSNQEQGSVVGKVYINKLLVTLFPSGQYVKNGNGDNNPQKQ